MINRQKAQWYCKDDISLIENYEQAINDKTQTWDCHHRRETIFSKSDLIEIGEYYKRPAIELIFLTQKEHLSLHHKNKNISEETKKKISEKKRGKISNRKGVKLSNETRKKMSESQKGNKNNLGHKHSEETLRKMSLARKLYWEKQRQLNTNPVNGVQL